MYLTAVDLSWEENVPPRTWQGRGWGERPWQDRFVPSREARVLSPAWARAKPGHRGHMWLASGNTDKPSPGFPKPSPWVTWTETDDRYRDADTGSDGSRKPQDTEGLWIPATCYLEELEPGSLHLSSSASRSPRRPWTGVLVKERDSGRWSAGWRLSWGLSSSPSPPPLVQPRRALSPQTIETTSSVPQETWLCVSGVPSVPSPLPPPFPSFPFPSPRHREKGRMHMPTMETEKRKCFIYGTYLISLFN